MLERINKRLQYTRIATMKSLYGIAPTLFCARKVCMTQTSERRKKEDTVIPMASSVNRGGSGKLER